MPPYPLRQRRIAACLSSYKRIDHLQRQVYSMLNQDYENLHVFVAVKGVTEYFYKMIIVPQFARYVEEGRLTLRFFPNKNQVSNLIDTVRGIDIDEYDLFAKVDDDDFYDRSYIKHINEFHDSIPEGQSSCYVGPCTTRKDVEDIAILRSERFYTFGASMVMSKRAMKLFMNCEQHPDQIHEMVPSSRKERWNGRFGFAEDNLLRMIIQDTGGSNIAPWLERNAIKSHVIVFRSPRSVMRGGLVNQAFRERNTMIGNDPDHYEHILEIIHPLWRDTFILIGDIIRRLPRQDHDTVLFFDGDRLHIKWHQFEDEWFVKREDGSYALEGM